MIKALAFQIGTNYQARLSFSWDTIYTEKVNARTARVVTILDDHGVRRRVGGRLFEGVEHCSPDGSYGTAPGMSPDCPATELAS